MKDERMMLGLIMKILPLLLALIICGCASQHKQDENQQQITELNKQLKELKESLRATQAKLSDNPSPKYQFSQARDGRTWRFDMASGGSCIQLTTDADWKRSGTKRQSCDCLDLLRELNRQPKLEDADIAYRKLECGW